MVFVASVRSSGANSIEICVLFVPRQKIYSIVLQSPHCTKISWNDDEREYVRDRMLDFYIQHDGYRNFPVLVETEFELDYVRNLALPGLLLTSERFAWTLHVLLEPRPFADLQTHLEKYHSTSGYENCAVERALRLRNAILETQKNNLRKARAEKNVDDETCPNRYLLWFENII